MKFIAPSHKQIEAYSFYGSGSQHLPVECKIRLAHRSYAADAQNVGV